MKRTWLVVLAVVVALAIALILMKKPSDVISPDGVPSGVPGAEPGAVPTGLATDPITGLETDPATGQVVDPANPQPVGQQIDPATGQPMTKYVDTETLQPLQHEIDPATGEPVAQVIDPTTGKPAPQEIEPKTGKRVVRVVDPSTGQTVKLDPTTGKAVDEAGKAKGAVLVKPRKLKPAPNPRGAEEDSAMDARLDRDAGVDEKETPGLNTVEERIDPATGKAPAVDTDSATGKKVFRVVDPSTGKTVKVDPETGQAIDSAGKPVGKVLLKPKALKPAPNPRGAEDDAGMRADGNRPGRAKPGSKSSATGGFEEGATGKAGGPSARRAGKATGGFDDKDESQFVKEKAAPKRKPGDPLKPVPKPVNAAYGVKGPRVWLVASDLRDIQDAPKFEVGLPEGNKGSPWRNRAGANYGDGLRVANGTHATFLRDFPIHNVRRDVVGFCSPGAPDCLSKLPSQLKSGLDMSHADHWLSGSDKKGKSETGGGSFTILFVAARGSSVPNPLLEHQNGEAYGRKGPFLGWIGTDMVGSVHGNQGVVSISAIAVANPYSGKPVPQIYTLRFNRAKEELRLFALGEKGSESKTLKLPKGDGPDNDQFAAYAIGSKTPGEAAVTYVYEHLAFPRALSNRELCTIHQEWNGKYALRVPSYSIEPCSNE